MKMGEFYHLLTLCLIATSISAVDHYGSFGSENRNTQSSVHYDNLILQVLPAADITASLVPSKQPVKVEVDLNEQQIETIMTKIFEQLPAAAENSADDIKEAFQTVMGSFINLENAIRYGYPIAFWAALSLSGIYGSRVLWKVIEKKLVDPKPDILLPGSKYGYWDRLKRQRANYTSPSMIFDQQIKDRLIEIQEKTKNIRNHIRDGKTATYDNLLLHGKPGTGKTLFAQILADYTDMDFLPVTAASLLQSGVEGVKYFNELLDMAKRSTYGIIIFVDEADALFIDRNTLSPSSDHYKVLNHILALTGTGSSKFMLIAATNHAYVMDEAMGRRFQDRVLMPLPDATTRKELITLYSNTVLYNTIKNSSDFVSAARSLLTDAMINTIIQKTASLSHAEIKDMIYAMHKKALATTTGIITATHRDDAVNQAIEKALALQTDQQKREQRSEREQANAN